MLLLILIENENIFTLKINKQKSKYDKIKIILKILIGKINVIIKLFFILEDY